MLDVERVVTGPLEQNCYLVSTDRREAVVVDPGGEPERIEALLGEGGLTLKAIVATHAHADHVAGAAPLAVATSAPFHLHGADAALLARLNFYRAVLHGASAVRVPHIDVDLTDRSHLRLGGIEVRVLRTPGHTPGGVCFEIGGELFTGDTLLAAGPGRTDFPGGDRATLCESIAGLAKHFPADTTVRPGHGGPVELGHALRGVDWPAEASR